jgi:hypothetical protein
MAACGGLAVVDGDDVPEPLPPEEQACVEGGGEWVEEDGCAGAGDWCDRPSCEFSVDPGCHCPEDECWDPLEERCRPGN